MRNAIDRVLDLKFELQSVRIDRKAATCRTQGLAIPLETSAALNSSLSRIVNMNIKVIAALVLD